MYGTLLGEQALRLVIMTFILQRFRARLRFFPLWQQALAIGALLLNDRIVSAAVHTALGTPQLPWAFWWAPLLGMLLWAPLFLTSRGPRVIGSLYLDQGFDFYRLARDGRQLDARIGHVTIGFGVGSGF